MPLLSPPSVPPPSSSALPLSPHISITSPSKLSPIQLQTADINIHNTHFGTTPTPQKKGQNEGVDGDDEVQRKKQKLRRRGSRRKLFGKCWDLQKQRKFRQDWRRCKHLMQEPWHLPVTSMQLAAARIQSVIRRFLVFRRGLKGHPLNVSRPSPSRPSSRSSRASTPSRRSKPNTLMAQFMATLPPGSPTAPMLYPAYCATRISAWFRGIRAIGWFTWKKYRIYTIAALLIQNRYREFFQMRYLQESSFLSATAQMSPSDKAAKIIQDMWRGCSGVKIFKFYRDLINFRLSGDPRLLLKTINPGEASLFDAATKIHIRLRLGGSSFPPTLYYKIFSSGPMCDIGSFAPRDYTVSSGVNLDPSSLHNKSRLAQRDYPRRFEGSVTVGRREFGAEGFIGNEGTEGWYERVENNGWRAVTVKAQDELREDSVEIATAKRKSSKFHFSKVLRKRDIEAERKKKKRDWLRRMYSVGLASEKEDGKMSVVHRQAEVQRHLMQGSSATKGSDLAMFNEHMRERGEDDYIEIDSEGEVDVEVEKLLNWSENLDFDGYTRNWGMIGTSGTSSVRGTVENTMESYVAYEEAKSKETKEWESQGLEEEEFFDYGLGL
ncbi:hypothetical protein TrCOL_g7308 [Triparma columacea]|uniref:Uncharacterized protein n=1 Tax=Triparma columacea TaxID=722753 RepID=A0A9W7FZ24_9STRA|nr:hypothetical protein TrCOL_g7308 [Triparma columacea]